MKPGYLKLQLLNGSHLRLGLLLCLAFVFSGCSVWNPWGYKKEWPVWKKTVFFLGPGHCPVCYCVGGGAIELVKTATGDRPKAQDQDIMVAMAGNPVSAGAGQADSGHAKASSIPNRGPLPRLMDLGATKCIPCKMMAPILEELKQEYTGKLEVVFIDVWENAGAGKKYGINLIPTQIFFDASGKELFRHEGFFGKEDILAKWKDLGINLAEVKN